MKTMIKVAALAAAAILPGTAQATIDYTSDPILFWNQQLVSLLAGPPPAQTRAAAMLNIAMHDAANSVLGKPQGSYLDDVSGFGGDVRAAVSQAAFRVLSTLDPTHVGDASSGYTKALNDSLSLVSGGSAKSKGIMTGDAFGSAILARRAGDVPPPGFSYTPGGADGILGPGEWRPTTPGGTPALPWWGTVKPFVLDDVNQFAPAPPPALGSPEYQAALAEVKLRGYKFADSVDLDGDGAFDRTAEQTKSAQFWAASNGFAWLQIGLGVAEDEGLSTIDYAHAFALLGIAQADAGFTLFNAKYSYEFWRPITAIQEDPTSPDPSWESLIAAPMHPSYISAHSSFSSSGSAILLSIFGDEAFDLTQGGILLHFDSLEAAALDAANSRLWGGIHYRFDNEAGLKLGGQVARYVLASDPFARAVPEPATWGMMIAGFAAIGMALRRRRMSIAFA